MRCCLEERSPPPESLALRSPRAARRGLRRGHRIHPDRRRLAFALLLSLLAHALLLSLKFGGQELGFPGFGFPWQERRIEVPELRVVLVPPRAVAAGPAAPSVLELLQRAPIGPPVTAAGPVHGPSESTTQPPPETTNAIAPQADRTAKSVAQHDFGTSPVDATAPLDANGPSDAARAPIPEPVVIALERPDEAAWAVPPAASAPSPVAAAAPGASGPEALEAARLEAARLEAARPDAEKQAATRRQMAEHEAARQEAVRVEAERVETERLAAQQAAARRAMAEQEAARQETARVEAARAQAERLEAAQQAAARRELAERETARQEAARIEAARLEAERLEAARQTAARRALAQEETARQEAARVEAGRLEAERLDAAQQAAARLVLTQQHAARQEAARVEAERSQAERLQEARKETERREAARRAMGRQLDEEAAQREAAATAARQPDTRPFSLSTARRGRLWGRTDPNAELVLYAEALARKIQFNTAFAVVGEVAKRPHRDPLVTVALRRDGSVESVTFDISSGVPEIDEAIRRIVQSHVPYQAFPPGLARDFDVIEIRRTWYFDVAVRLY